MNLEELHERFFAAMREARYDDATDIALDIICLTPDRATQLYWAHLATNASKS